MTTGPTAAAPQPADNVNHGRRVIVAWLVLSAIATPLVAVFVGPLIPPGNSSWQGQGQVFDNQVMTSLVTPILCLLAVFFGYGLVQFRAKRGEALVDGPPLRNDSQVQVVWVAITTSMVLFLAGFGTYELLKDGAGGGQGPSPIAFPANHQQAFQVQVIGQQWQFTYRYPSLGGMESNQLVLPANTDVALHVTSLDVVHSFWAVELGIKADANPGVDNVTYVETKNPTNFHVRCAELCGLWHGYMFNNGRVLDSSKFQSWAASQEKIYASIKKYMPPYAKTYLPDPQRRAG
ncbi:MAG TPA: cytochrome c oxidase subunit II [Gaiellaceae bacterium]|jgi:cytochrome c oxidase subunit 2|nr:cytochrome c oxidase subunit II [Gaiellaceae bacterium]